MDLRNSQFVQFFIQIGGNDCVNATGPREGVLLEYSLDGGTVYNVLEEMEPEDHRYMRLKYVQLPSESYSAHTKLRWWQPSHSGLNRDQWTLDGIYLDSGIAVQGDAFAGVANLPASFTVATHYTIAEFCSVNDSLVVDGQGLRFLVTRPIRWTPGHVISFKISVGCSIKYDPKNSVLLEYSKDNGENWQRLPIQNVNGEIGSEQIEYYIFRSGIQGLWSRVLVPMSEELEGDITLRFVQFADDGFAFSKSRSRTGNFAIKDFGVGPRCDGDCSGNGDCISIGCHCDIGFKDSNVCAPDVPKYLTNFLDTFDGVTCASGWKYVIGGTCSLGCGILASGKSLYFGGIGLREAVTLEFNTTDIEYVHFVVKLGSNVNMPGCRLAKNRTDNIFVDFSPNGGLTWSRLLELDYSGLSGGPTPVALKLPTKTRKEGISFRWRQKVSQVRSTSQLDLYEGAEWALDNVLLRETTSMESSFQDDFASGLNSDAGLIWYRVQGGQIHSSCRDNGKSIVFKDESASSLEKITALAETWDFDLLAATFLQFEINLNCQDSKNFQKYSSKDIGVSVQYSPDRGKSWKDVVPECWPPECPVLYDLLPGSRMITEMYSNWTRVNLYLTEDITSLSTVRFRWISSTATSFSWSLDNVYLGDGCIWMCSGHGNCLNSTCKCDSGYGGKHCVPLKPNPKVFTDNFDSENRKDSSLWSEISGGDVSLSCGVLVAGSALVFNKDEPRMAVTADLDLSSATFVEFYSKYGCTVPVSKDPPLVYLQFSNNGGITWHTIKELQPSLETVQFHHYSLKGIKDLHTNSTRLRFLQKPYYGKGLVDWAIDDLIIWGLGDFPVSSQDSMQIEPNSELWLSWPGSKPGGLMSCLNKDKGLMFDATEGFRFLTSVELNLPENSNIQFDIVVGCDANINNEHPVSLDYSVNGGLSWTPVIGNCIAEDSDDEIASCSAEPTKYFSGSGVVGHWRRVIVSLNHIRLCGSIRFRWTQGFVNLKDSAPTWALRNIYIGPGNCPTCQPMIVSRKPLAGLKEEFESFEINSKFWSRWNGAEISQSCGMLASGSSLVFRFRGERVLVTQPLDLTRSSVVQFHLRLGCGITNSRFQSHSRLSQVLLSYSVDGGLTWVLLSAESINFSKSRKWSGSDLIAVELPQESKQNGTILRWWQPQLPGNISFIMDWALDQIYIGGYSYNDLKDSPLQDDPFGGALDQPDNAFIQVNGASNKDTFCGEPGGASVLHFIGGDENKYAITGDLSVTSSSYLQFELAMGCRQSEPCYNISLEFSTDRGRSWEKVWDLCTPSQPWCNRYGEGSTYSSSIKYQKQRVYVALPPEVTNLGTVRFRLIQTYNKQGWSEPWSVGKFSVASTTFCLAMCSGRGECLNRKCLCDDNWMGPNCESPLTLYSEIKDGFTKTMSDLWKLSSGGVVSDLCGSMPSGSALHFYGGCVRLLETVDLDLTKASVIQFVFKYGCISNPNGLRDENVLFQWSSNSGATWTTLTELDQNYYKTYGQVSLSIDQYLKLNGVRFRFWQPSHPGRALSDWAVDDLFIGDSVSGLKGYSTSVMPESFWLRLQNVKIENVVCGDSTNALVASSSIKEPSVVETKDMRVEIGDVLHFQIRVGCDETKNYWSSVGLEYSTNFGRTWALVKSHSTFYAEGRWISPKYDVGTALSNKTVRFRWTQDTAENAPSWFIRSVYVGPYCSCGYNNLNDDWTCDECETVNITRLTDDFESGFLDSHHWLRAYGVAVTASDRKNVNKVALFQGVTSFLESVDLDLRGAAFVSFVINVITQSNNHIPKCEVHLTVSKDGGLNWSVLRTFVIRESGSKRVFTQLESLSNSSRTRFRWSWMVTPLNKEHIGNNEAVSGTSWFLDDVIVGGSKINPPTLFERFGDSFETSNFWFWTSGKVKSNFCNRPESSMTFEAALQSSITSRQLIISSGFMIQFKISVSCGGRSGGHTCDIGDKVVLEYRTDPPEEENDENSSWLTLMPPCLPTTRVEPGYGCQSISYRDSSFFSKSTHGHWRRVSWMLPEETFSSLTQFRWRQERSSSSVLSWALTDLYIGESCPFLCRGHGDCIEGLCICDLGYHGEDCGRTQLTLPNAFEDIFDVSTALNGRKWYIVTGGGVVTSVSSTCGPLVASSAGFGGSHLYFWDCDTRQAVTQPLDTSGASKLSFVLKIGSADSNSGCHLLKYSSTVSLADKAIFLLFSVDSGNTWNLISSYDASSFADGRQVILDLPIEAKSNLGVQFRWVQGAHDGAGHDQWALDDVRIIRSHLESPGGGWRNQRWTG